VADDFVWAQDFFGESCQSIWVAPEHFQQHLYYPLKACPTDRTNSLTFLQKLLNVSINIFTYTFHVCPILMGLQKLL
jgi:hypothetical protein